MQHGSSRVSGFRVEVAIVPMTPVDACSETFGDNRMPWERHSVAVQVPQIWLCHLACG